MLTLNLLNFSPPLLLICGILSPCQIRKHDYNGNGSFHLRSYIYNL